jgi:hypothetical protein
MRKRDLKKIEEIRTLLKEISRCYALKVGMLWNNPHSVNDPKAKEFERIEQLLTEIQE